MHSALSPPSPSAVQGTKLISVGPVRSSRFSELDRAVCLGQKGKNKEERSIYLEA